MFVSKITQDNVTESDRNLIIEMFDFLMETYEHLTKTQKERSSSRVSYNCHSICRALNMFYGDDVFSLHDGSYRGMTQTVNDGKDALQWEACLHSWLKTGSGSILDPYPVGILNPYPILYVNGGQDAAVVNSHFYEEPIYHYENFDKRSIASSAYWLLYGFQEVSGKKAQQCSWRVASPN